MTTPADNEQACNAPEKGLPESNPQTPREPSNLRKLLIIVAAFMLNFSGCGLLFSFGIYQSLYEDMSRKENNPFAGASSAEISLIGSIAAAFMKLGAPYVVAWCKYFSPQRVVFVGGLIYGVASVLASFGQALWHFQLTQGLLVGIGTCLSFMPSMAVPPSWFGQYRGLNMGIISAGTGIGGLVWSPILTACIQNLGFRNTLRLTGCICTVLICASGAVLSWEPKMAAKLQKETLEQSWVSGLLKVPLPPREIVTTRKFVAQSLNAVFQSAAYYTPIFYIAAYSKTLGYSDSEGSNFTALSNACNAIGKVGVGFVADKIGRLDSFFLTTLLSSVSTAGLWVPSTVIGTANESSGRGLFIGFTILYGLFASAYIGLFSPALVEFFGMENMPRITGIMYFLQGAAGFVGTPVAGVLVGSLGGNLAPENYVYMAVFVGALMVASTVTVFWARMEVMVERMQGGTQWLWKL
ncbi:monocarboxylate transporter [Aspergillus nomiae NRRL 13137]|uniref:Monocarboxylate transporter n=1 Tax=Aspergillus nomiae NRRL (strain ATCC 15546 / NRRL 13137 / CBS 260.88 / M93) TaxID=1509407 RepID=A0A0L1IZL7_ASPN3|nr:monocarboxylate transporter [Aspergillus nomiae NRRL 13137]KNG84870.1 monocarboxylate transporter [Aspergillus nomiae NRRL 13137]